MSGRLDLRMGGPGVQQFKLGKPIQLTPTVDYAPFDWDSPGAGRRSIYRFVYRGLQDPFMDALDFPDAAQLAPTRPFSASVPILISPSPSPSVASSPGAKMQALAGSVRLGLQPGDDVRAALAILDAREGHLGADDVLARFFQEVI